MYQENVVVVGGSAALDRRTMREVRSMPLRAWDIRVVIFAVVSIAVHVGFFMYIHSLKLAPREAMVLEKMPERFARLIIDKPLPKTEALKKPAEKSAGPDAAAKKVEATPEAAPEASAAPSAAERAAAQKAVAKRAAKVEEKIRSVGALGILTGLGTTAKGPGVVDVLGAIGGGKERNQNLDDALANMKGLQTAQNIDFMDRKLVKSKDAGGLYHREGIDDMLASVSTAPTTDLMKKGEFIIRRPESIEGAASTNARRDEKVISGVVTRNKAGIKLTYERFLKRDPALAGKITVRFTIASDGSVSMVEIVENTTGNTELESEIVRKVRMWQFDPVPEGDATVTYPFLFQPST